jgi:DNA-binding NarL/FixJ family response regulator
VHEGGRAIKVLICDDVPELRALYRLWLDHEPDMELIGEAVDGSQVIGLTAELDPDVILLDIHMPLMSGFDALRAIRLSHPRTKVIVFTGFEGYQMARAARELGASDFIEKGTRLHEVADRIRAAVTA